jgi:PAS domain S-box-containing protein
LDRHVGYSPGVSEAFQELVEHAPDGVVILDRGSIVFINATAARLLGVARDAALGTPIGSYLPPHDAAAAGDRIRRMMATGEPMIPNEYGTLADPTRTVEIKSIPWQWQGRPAVLAFARDVTERKALQQHVVRADRLVAIGTLAAGVAHEINNPLQYMQLGVELLSRALAGFPDAREAVAEHVSNLEHGITRISAISRTLRGFARTSDSKPGPVDATPIVDRALAMVANEVRHRARIVRNTIDGPCFVLANGPQLEQVLVNLLVNAIQALTGAGDDTITVTLRAIAGERIALSVEDTGHGMPEEVRARVFDPFFTTKRAGDGMGLGLSVSKSLVEAMNGDIELTSAPGKGTTATVIVRAYSGTPQLVEHELAHGPSRRVLVIDDEQRVRDSLRDLVGAYHEVTVADSGPAALALLDAHSFDVILCDVMMPEMNGIDVYRTIAETRPGLEDRIVFMSGGAFIPALAELVASTPNRRIDKPFELSQILAAIAAVRT